MPASHQLGKYRLIAELGHGGMADVFLALVEGPAGSGFAKLAVVKRLRANLVDDPEFVTMLIDEARITARLNHPNVVQMLEVGVEGEEYFLAMEYLDGQPLHRIERRASRSGTPISAEAHMALLVDVLAGLEHAHALADYDGTPLDIVHRDVTPHNIFLTYDGQVKVMDFGIAKAAGRAQETQHGVVKGKVRYMSPEQAMGQPLDRRADIFAVGILLWQAATGTRFWGERDDFAIVQALITGDYEPSPRAVAPNVPPEVDRICRRALARHADDRYLSASDMRLDLEAYLGPGAMREKRAFVAMTNELFAKERRDLRGIVEKITRGSISGPSPVALLSRPSASSTSIPAIVATVRPQPPVSVSPSLAPPVLTTLPAPAPSKKARPFDRALAVGSIAAAALSLAALVSFATGWRTTEAPRPRASAVVSDVTPLSIPLRPRAHHESTPRPPTVVFVTAPAPAAATAASSFAVPSAAPPDPRPTTIPSIQPSKSSHGRLNLDPNDPWNDNGAR